ncbi:MAG: hypothetical protein K1X64_05585 [Myxococcaceae bacterium]|nr:hypothetical protein [Myxococcaceae bacterium]
MPSVILRLSLITLWSSCLPEVGPLLADASTDAGLSPPCDGGACVDPCTGYAGCVTFIDATANPSLREVNFGQNGNQYTPPCLRIRLGQTVTFSGGRFDSHPIQQGCGPAPAITSIREGNARTFTFAQALGTYGYYCSAHGSAAGSGMAGAIEVVR